MVLETELWFQIHQKFSTRAEIVSKDALNISELPWTNTGSVVPEENFVTWGKINDKAMAS